MACDQRLYDPVLTLLPGIAAHCIIGRGSTMAENVKQVLAQAPDQFIVLGTSFGGRVALETALAAPERVRGLVVIGSGAAAAADPAMGFKRVERIAAGEFQSVVREMGEMVSYLPAVRGPVTRQAFIDMALDTGPELMAAQTRAMAGRADRRAALGQLAMPALMLWGREDLFSPAADGQTIASAMPNARYAEIAECGHFPTLEAPEETAMILHHWLQDHFSLEA